MADSLIGAILSKQPQKIDPNAFKPKSGGKLDLVIEGNIKKLKKKEQGSIIKIADYKPIQLKNTASNIKRSINQRKESAAIREAKDAIVKEKVQKIKEKNPFSNPIERMAGERINIKA